MKTAKHLLSLVSVVFTPQLNGQTSAFTYQGELSDGGSPANGSDDPEFRLYDAVTNAINFTEPARYFSLSPPTNWTQTLLQRKRALN